MQEDIKEMSVARNEISSICFEQEKTETSLAEEEVKGKMLTVDDWYGVNRESLPEILKGVYVPSEEEITRIAKMLYGECRGIPSDAEKAACIWCVYNRVDQLGGTVTSVITRTQFHGYTIS